MIQYIIGKYDRVKSTNLLMQKMKTDGKLTDGYVIIADYQDNGRGHGLNVWESEDGKNLLLSLYLKPDFLAAEDQFLLSMIISVAITDTLDNLAQQFRFSIKWPNDIYYENKKIAGILIENTIAGNYISETIIGIGININQTNFSNHLPNPISLKNITGKTENRDKILEIFLGKLNFYFERLKKGEHEMIRQIYLNKLFLLNKNSIFATSDGNIEGKIIGISTFGQLLIQTAGGNQTYNFKEIAYIIN